MDSFELNKILGAILGTLVFVMGVGFLAEGIYHPIEGRSPGYELPEPEEATHGEPAVAAVTQPIAVLLASADADAGKASARKCQSCHTFDQGGSNGQGPNLWEIVGRPIASHEGFAYSDAMKEHAAEDGTWTYEHLSEFILAPKAAVPGTKMNFAGVKDDEERANIIAFLSTLSAAPVPFPTPEAPPAAAEDVPVTETPAVEAPVAPAAEAPAPVVEPAPAMAAEPAMAPAEPAPAEPAMAPAEPAMAPAEPAMAPADSSPAMSAPAMAPADPAPATTGQ